MNMQKPIVDVITSPRLVDVYPPYKEKMEEFHRWMNIDQPKAEKVFAEAQAMAKAFWSGVEFARGRR